MALIDEVTLHLGAGKGGDGVVRWRREKYVPRGGPFGGKGGKGGDVIFQALPDISYLRRYRTKTTFDAEPGHPGETAVRTGKDGRDLVVGVPVGSLITEQRSGQRYDLIKGGERVVALVGGQGGRGNFYFKSSTNRSPRQFELGHPGQKGIFDIKLALIADVGIIGLPNAGKTTLLNALTNAAAKVGNYPFTTLEPNLGALGPIILADVPGLIEGAAQGKGLGDKFLRHITRTKLLVHCLALDDPKKPAERYKIIKSELGAYEASLLEKPEMVILTKADLVTKAQVTATAKQLGKTGVKNVLIVSSQDKDSVAELAKAVSRGLR